MCAADALRILPRMEDLTDEDLRALLAAPESDGVERKRALLDKDTGARKPWKVHHTLCAFANDLNGSGRPGVLFVGVDDDGLAVGVSAHKVAEALHQCIRSGNLRPMPEYQVRSLAVGDVTVVAAVVWPHRAPPVRFNGDVYVRRGAATVLADQHDERRLVERHRAYDLPYLEQTAWDAEAEDLDPILIARLMERSVGAETIRRNHREPLVQERSLRLRDRDGRPTWLGMLLASREGSGSLASASVQCIRLAGATRDSPVLDQRIFGPPLVSGLPALEQLLAVWNPAPIEVRPGPHQIRRVWPPEAVHEALINAVMHRDYALPSPVMIRWYDDRIEVTSPGGPCPPVTSADFVGEEGLTSYRNQWLAAALHNLGYAQRFGSGLGRIRRSMTENGNPEPEFRVTPDSVTVVLRRALEPR